MDETTSQFNSSDPQECVCYTCKTNKKEQFECSECKNRCCFGCARVLWCQSDLCICPKCFDRDFELKCTGCNQTLSIKMQIVADSLNGHQGILDLERQLAKNYGKWDVYDSLAETCSGEVYFTRKMTQ